MAVSERMSRMNNSIAFVLDKTEGFSGDIYNCYQKEPIRFSDLNEFFIIVNEILDELDFPAQKTKYRSFKKTLPTLKVLDIDAASKLCDVTELIKKAGKESYGLLVIGRDNATWQGMLYDSKKDEENTFNGDIQFLRLLNKNK